MYDVMNDSYGDVGVVTTEMFTDIGNITTPSPSLPRGFLICNQPNTFLWSVILAFGTFAIALFLRKLRKGKFLGKQVKRVLYSLMQFLHTDPPSLSPSPAGTSPGQ